MTKLTQKETRSADPNKPTQLRSGNKLSPIKTTKKKKNNPLQITTNAQRAQAEAGLKQENKANVLAKLLVTKNPTGTGTWTTKISHDSKGTTTVKQKNLEYQ